MAKKQNKIDVYTLGQHGINRVKTPVHVADGELLNSQNAHIKPFQAQLALSKRGGMSKINSTAAAGSLLKIHNLPINSIGDVATCVSVTPGNWQAGAWSPELDLFAITGSSGTQRIITSPDGETWTFRTQSSNGNAGDIVWANTLALFVAVGAAAMTSPTGITWTTRTTPSSGYAGAAWSEDLGLLVAIGNDGAVGIGMSSTDGITWTARSVPVKDWTSVAWSSSLNLFVGVANTSFNLNNNVMTSPDGITWTQGTTTSNAAFLDVVWSPELELFVAVGHDSSVASVPKVMYSADGFAWTAATFPTTFLPRAIAWSSGLGIFLTALAGPGSGLGYNLGALSPNGVDWFPYTPNCSQTQIRDIIWSPDLEKFVLVAQNEIEVVGLP